MRIRSARWVGLVLAFGLVASACGGSETTGEGTTGEDTTDGTTDDGTGDGEGAATDTDVLIVGSTEKPSSIDPAKVYEKFASDILFNTTNRLVEFAPGETEVGPGLATDWTISEDGLTYTFTLREGVKFHDGSDFDAEDVKYSLERSLKMNHPEGASFLIGSVDDIVVNSPTEIQITITQPNVTFLSRLNYTVASILPSDSDVYTSPDETLADGAGADDFVQDAAIVGTGPYTLAEFKPGESITLERFDDYWGEPAKIKTIKIQFFESSAQMKNALENGEIDLNINGFGPAERASLEQNSDITVFSGPGARIRYAVVDTRTAPFDDPKVRRSLSAGIDRQRIIDEVFEGAGTPLYSMIPTGFGEYRDYMSDLEVEVEGPVDIELWYPLNKYGDTEPDVAETIKRSLEETGVFNVELKSSDWATEFTGAAFTDKIYPFYLLGWYPDYFDADDYIEPFYSSGGFTGLYGNDAMDQLIEDQQMATDAAARTAIFDDIQKLAAEDMAFIPLYEEVPFAYYGPGVSGVETTMDPVQQLRYWVISKS